MMQAENVSFGLAFLAGLASFLSPCVLSLVPAYIGYLSIRAITPEGVVAESNRLHTFFHAVAFVVGFSIIFIALGAVVSGISQALYASRGVLTKVGGALIVLLGLAMVLGALDVVKIPFLYYDTRLQWRARPELGYTSSLLMGVFFAAGWSPCVGPVLGAIYTLAYAQETLNQAVLLLVAYSLGLGIPFLLAGLALDRLSGLLAIVRRHGQAVSVAGGLLLAVIGVLVFTNTLEQFANFGAIIGL